MRKFADVVIFKNLIFMDKPFTYLQDLDVVEGDFVIVDFNNSLEIGLVINTYTNDMLEGDYKPILKVINELQRVPKKYLDLGHWMRNFYVLTYAKSFGTIVNTSSITNLEYKYIPTINDSKVIELVSDINETGLINNATKKRLQEYIEDEQVTAEVTYTVVEPESNDNFIFVTELSDALKQIRPNATRQWALILEIYEYFKEKGYFRWKELYSLKNYSKQVFDQLLEKSIFKRSEKIEHLSKRVELSSAQEQVLQNIISSDSNKFLIHGITGSGKTEIYFELIEHALENDGTALLLVPEISLTPQIQQRIVDRFGPQVAIYHSKLTKKERITELSKIQKGDAKIMLGTRSAVFVPMPNLKLIIVDEEHDSSYKLDRNNKYDVREVSRYIVEKTPKSKLVLGSATPSVETYFKAEHNVYQKLEINERYQDTPLPKVLTVDMREELKHGNNTPFSMDLMLEMKRALSSNEQVLLFLNRRGYAPFVSCRDCGEPVVCDRCDVSMVYHQNKNYLSCHYCGSTKPYPRVCPNCGSSNIRHFGMGTEQLQSLTEELFPDHKVYRIDSDTTTRLDEYQKNIQVIEDEDVDIVIGTQMITKGLDFPNIGLVGVLAADLSLNMPDYEAAENTFQLLTQVAGRSGRSKKRGTVVVQTYNPEHFSIMASEDHNYEEFYQNEIMLRRIFNYPPFVRRFTINIIGQDPNKTVGQAKNIINVLREVINKENLEKSIDIVSMADNLYSQKINNRYYVELTFNSRVRDEDKAKSLLYELLFDNKYKLDLKGLHVDLVLR